MADVLPAFAHLAALTEPIGIEEVFEYGLQRQLDGLAAVLAARGSPGSR